DAAGGHVVGIVQRRDGRGKLARAAGVENLEGHQLAGPTDAGHIGVVVADGGDGAGDVRAVAQVIHWIVVIIGEVPAVNVVAVAVAVVVDAIAGDFKRIGPDVGGQIGVGVIDATVDDADNHVGWAGGQV